MSYTPHEWQNDELITAARLNNIEKGIAEGGGGASGLCVFTDGTLDKSYNDLLGMVNRGIIPFIFRTGYLYILGTLDPTGDGIGFKENTESGFTVLFSMPNDDPDANLMAE